MAFIYDLTDTWNAGGTTFSAIKMNVTDTASAAASKLITVQVGGTEKFSVRKDGFTDVNGNLRLSAATAAIELNTGGPQVYVPAANTFAIATGGGIGSPVERLRVDASGNVGIGTSSPDSKVDIEAANSQLRLTDSDDSKFAEFSYSSGKLVVRNNSTTTTTEQFTLDGSGRLGIGTISPAYKVSVGAAGDKIGFSSGSNYGYWEPYDASGNMNFAINWAGGSTEAITFTTGASEKMRIDNSGNVGIGTSSPTNLLDLNGGITVQQASDVKWQNTARDTTYGGISSLASALQFKWNGSEKMRIDSSGTIIAGATAGIANARAHFQRNSDANYTGGVTVGTSSAQLVLRDVSNTTTYPDCYTSLLFGEGATGAHWQYIAGVRNAGLVFGTATGSTPTERMRITSAGSVGIGTSSPDAKLHVSGDTFFVNAVAGRGFQLKTIASSNGRNDNAVQYSAGDVSSAEHIWGYGGADSFTERMRIDSSGNVGIGTSSPSEKLELSANDSVALRLTSTDTGATAGDTLGVVQFYGSDASSAGAGVKSSIEATAQGAGGAASDLRFYTSDGATNNQQRMCIDLSGNVGIGTSSPANTNGGLDASGALIARGGIAAHQTSAGAFDVSGNDLRIRSYGATAGTGSIAFRTGGGAGSSDTERGRISGDGQWRWGDTATIDTVSYLPFQITNGIAINTTSTAPASAMSFFNGQGSGTRVGWIGTSGSSTSYNTSSDQRLKENIADADDAGALIDTIQVRQFDWRLNGEHQAYGMVAQELDNVYPDAVSHGPTEDDMMAVDYSKLVPMLVKEIQSMRLRLAQLEG